MKRGKDEEKVLEPMFPRLHVNDADKGGPRAPPRNKMALYEQLSIPSQRFSDHGSLPRNTTTLVPPGPSHQPCGVERHLSGGHLDSSSTGQATDNFVSQMPFMENMRTPAQHDQRKIAREEDDFAVPVFVNSRKSQCHGRRKSGVEKEKHNSLVKGSTKRGGFVNSSDISATEGMDIEKSASSCDRVNDCSASLRQESRKRLDQDGGETRMLDSNNGVDSHIASESHTEEGHGSPNDVDNGRGYCRSGRQASLQQINEEASDDVSDNSMVDSVSSVDVSPDDVVGVLGQKRFWRARKAIANQQRVFAVQLFELHRLIKVQRLIAASPDVLLDDISYLGKVAAKSYPVKKLLPSEFIVKPPLPQVIKHRSSGDSEKTDQHKMERSAENVVGGRLSNQGHHHQPSNYMPFANNPPTASPAVNGCCYPPQPPPPSGGNQQWLIPVMSPSEGLIYKPHPGPGHTGPVCGGYYGHFMPTQMVMGNFMGGGPPPPFHPGMGFPSPGGNGYFPPYGMMPPMMNPYYSGQQQQQPNEQMNQFGHPGNFQNATTALNNTQQQSSVNEVTSQQQPAKSYPRARKNRQGSTASSPSGRQEGISGKEGFRDFSAVNDDNNAPEERLTTTTTTTTTVTQTTRDGAGVTRVIKVVPHNAKLASENAAKIFRSIQEERKQYDSFSNYP